MKFILLQLYTLFLVFFVTGCGKEPKLTEKIKSDELNNERFFPLQEIQSAITSNNLLKLNQIISQNPKLNLDVILHDGETPLIYSIKKGFEGVTAYLIDRGVSIEKTNVNEETPLIAAVTQGQVNIVKILLGLKANLEKKDMNDDTALHKAIKKNQDEIAVLLITNGANLESTDRYHQTALMLANQYVVPNAQKLIVAVLKADVSAPDTATFIKILNQGDFKRLDQVINRFPSIIKDYESLNPLALLVDASDEAKALKSAELLIGHAVNLNGPQNAEPTPLLKAVLSQKTEFATLFLNAKAKPHILDKSGKSPLIHAIELNNYELVELFLNFNAPEKYSTKISGKKITINGCEIADNLEPTLTSDVARSINREIRSKLNCSFFRWPF